MRERERIKEKEKSEQTDIVVFLTRNEDCGGDGACAVVHFKCKI